MHDLDDDDNFSMRFQSLEEVVGQVNILLLYRLLFASLDRDANRAKLMLCTITNVLLVCL